MTAPPAADAIDTPPSNAADAALARDLAHAADAPPRPLELDADPNILRRRKLLRRTLKWAVAAVVLAFVGHALYGQIKDATAQEVAFRWPFALASGVALVGLYACLMFSERSLLHSFAGVRIPLGTMAAVAWVPLAGKYVPGKVASVAGAIVLLRRVGISAAVGLSVLVVFDAVPLLTGAVLSGLLAFNDDLRVKVNEAAPAAWTVLACVVLGGIVCAQPPVFRFLINFGLRILRRPPLPRVPRVRDYAGPILWSLGQWASISLALYLMCVAFAPAGQAPPLRRFPDVVGIITLTMCVSYFSAFLTPGGLGVREALLLPLLSTLLPPPAAAATTVAMRLAHMLVEFSLCGVGLLLLRRADANANRS